MQVRLLDVAVAALALAACGGDVVLGGSAGDGGAASTGDASAGSGDAGGDDGAGLCSSVPGGGGATPGTPVVLATGVGAEVVVDGANLYTTRPMAPNLGVYRVPLDGGSPVALQPVGGYFVAMNASSVFSTSVQGGTAPRSLPTAFVAGCPKTGCAGGYDALTPAQPGLWDIAADDVDVYFSGTGSGIGKMPVSGGPTTFIGSGLTGKLAVNGGQLFYAGTVDGADKRFGLLSASTDGGLPTVLVTPSASYDVVTLTVDCTNVYYATSDGRVMKVARTGGAATTLASGQSFPFVINMLPNEFPSQMAVDADRVYFADGASNSIRSVPIGGGAVTTLASMGTDFWLGGLSVDAHDVYWTSIVTVNGVSAPTVWKMPK